MKKHPPLRNRKLSLDEKVIEAEVSSEMKGKILKRQTQLKVVVRKQDNTYSPA